MDNIVCATNLHTFAKLKGSNIYPFLFENFSGLSTGEVIVWKVLTGEVLHTLDDRVCQNSVVTLSLSPDGTYISSGHSDRKIKIWSFQVKSNRRWGKTTKLTLSIFK